MKYRNRTPGVRAAAVSFVLVSAIFLRPSTIQGADRDEKVAWLRQHTNAIKSIDPQNIDFSDLGHFADSIADARVVILGEASHGDGSSFLAKSRLARFLHEELAFNVMVWESSFYDCAIASKSLADLGRWQSAVNQAVLPIWTGSRQCQEIFEYLHRTQSTGQPMFFAGCSWYLAETSSLFDDVAVYVRSIDSDLPTTLQNQALQSIKVLLQSQSTRPGKAVRPPELEQIAGLILAVQSRLEQAGSPEEKRIAGFMTVALENLREYVLERNRPLSKGGSDDSPIGIQEGRNLVFLARDYFPGEKLIVWCHSGHAIRNTRQIEDGPFHIDKALTMGHVAHQTLGSDMFTIIALAHHGHYGLWWDDPRQLPTPPGDSLEDLFHQTGMVHGLLDLRRIPSGVWLSRPLVASPIAYSPMRSRWPEIADAIFFIDEMSPSKGLSIPK
ncbi:MAG: erythromycin esterase family protein [Phycisphaerales bacterium]|nr:erythromycin esterase family protein [Phycisphaerales bacterium]